MRSNQTLALLLRTHRNTMHLFAPGGEITSTFPNSSYETLSGTSMACPHVSGAAALLWAHAPAATYLQIKEAILAGVDKVPAAAETSITGVSGWEVALGSAAGIDVVLAGANGLALSSLSTPQGRLNVNKALQALNRILMRDPGTPVTPDPVTPPAEGAGLCLQASSATPPFAQQASTGMQHAHACHLIAARSGLPRYDLPVDVLDLRFVVPHVRGQERHAWSASVLTMRSHLQRVRS
jgi:hypothetical protein